MKDFDKYFFEASSKRSVNPKRELAPSSAKRYSIPNDMGLLSTFDGKYRTVNHRFLTTVIPIIRSLVYLNPDMGQVVKNIISLGNTGHKVYFDRTTDPAQVDEMREFLDGKKDEWSTGTAGMDGLVNKMFGQGLIGGALSTEWVPNKDLTDVDQAVLVNPEQIEFLYNIKTNRYEPYQRPEGFFSTGDYQSSVEYGGAIKLNTNTYRYYALNGDQEIPYGIPPYMKALDRVKSQKSMLDNIDFIVDQLSLIGFLEVLLNKPDQDDMGLETDEDYDGRLQGYLSQASARMKDSLKDGIVVGFTGDHAFKFNSFGKDYERAVELFKQNELQLISGLEHDPSLMGRDYNTSESQITVIFLKMISELANIQRNIAHNLEFGYKLSLRLAGFDFKFLKVKFRRSTIQDELKYHQAEEIKIRNVKDKLILGMIDQDTAADELDYDYPAFEEPQVSWDVLAGQKETPPAGLATDESGKKKDAAKKKDGNDKKNRDKNKPVIKK